MPQIGLHLSAAILGTGSGLFSRRASSVGFLVGNVLPDLDFLPLILVYFFNRPLALSLHRGFTHSLLFILLAMAVTFLPGVLGNNAAWFRFGVGLSCGLLLHVFLDLFMWFKPPNPFWPILLDVGFLKERTVSDAAWNLVFATESLCYAIYLALIFRRRHARIATGERILLGVLVAVTVVLSVVGLYLPRTSFEAIAYAPAILFALPVSVWFTIKYRNFIFPAE